MKETKRLEDKVFNFIKEHNMLSPGDRVAAGVSGGADSVCLLFMLMEWARHSPLSIAVVHVNHGIREEAEADARYVEELCARYGLPYYLERADVPEKARREKISEEEAGRMVRYEAFHEAARRFGADRIAVAHNANDRAETMLFHLFRGTGLTGLSGIRPVREQIIRPILCLERAEVERYLRARRIPFCSDSTNEEDDYTRNRIRHHIIPFAEKEVAKGCVSHMGRTADMLMETADYLQEQTDAAMAACVRGSADAVMTAPFRERVQAAVTAPFRESVQAAMTAPFRESVQAAMTAPFRESVQAAVTAPFRESVQAAVTAPVREEAPRIYVDIPSFMEFHSVIRGRLLYQLLRRLSPLQKDIAYIHVRDVMSLFEKEGNRAVCLPYGIRCRRQYEEVILEVGGESPKPAGGAGEYTEYTVNPADIASGGLLVDLQGQGSLEFTLFSCEKTENIPQNRYTKWFDYDKIKKSLVIRPRRSGDYLTIRGKDQDHLAHKQLKDYLITEKIPREQRDLIPLLAEEDHILWVAGYRISEYYKINENTKRILQVQLRGSRAGGGMEETNGGTNQGAAE